MGRAFEFRKVRKMKRWSAMAKTFTRIGKDIVMAVKLSLLLLVYLSTPIIVAQSYNEYVTAEVYFLDGTRKDGLALVKPSSDKISFKENKVANRVKYNHNDVARLVLKKDTIARVFRYKKVPDRRAPRLLQVVVENPKISMYATFINYKPGGLISAIFNIDETDYTYYLVKNQSKDAIYIGERGLTSKKHMSKLIKKYMSDCTYLIERANKKELKLKDTQQIVEYYNRNCPN